MRLMASAWKIFALLCSLAASDSGKFTLIGGVGTGPELTVRGWARAFESAHKDEVAIDDWPSGGSKSQAALVGNVDCKKMFKGHDKLCSNPPAENETYWGSAGLTFPGTWYDSYANLGLQLLPSLVGPLCIAYSKDVTGNLGSSVDKRLNLSLALVGDIFGGRITFWDDVAIASINQGIALPHERISVVVRSDKSSLNEHLTKRISSASSWWSKVPTYMEKAVGKQPKWPLANYSDPQDKYYVTNSGQQSMVVSALRTPFSITYVDMTQIKRFGDFLGAAHVQNDHGKFVAPTDASLQSYVDAFASKFSDPSSLLAADDTTPTNEDAYPITRLMYWYVKKNASVTGDCYKAWLLKEFISFSYSKVAQAIAEDQGWVLPSEQIIQIVRGRMKDIMCVNDDTKQVTSVSNYTPPRYRSCPRGQHLKSAAGAVGVHAVLGCHDCPAGSYQPVHLANIAACVLSPKGGYVPFAGQDRFIPCGPGYFQSKEGQDRCTPCPAGTYQPSSGASECLPCLVGASTANYVGSANCVACPRNSFAATRGSASCSTCPTGLVTRDKGSTNETDCGCGPGYFMLQDRRSCERCPEGLECPGFRELLRAAPGFMIPESRAFTVPLTYRCLPSTVCPGGPPVSCSGGRVGVACALCPKQQQLMQGTCQPCSGIAGMWAFLLMGAAVMFASSLTYGIALYSSSRLRSSDSSVQVVLLVAAGSSIVQVMQVLGVFGMMTVDWPVDVDSLRVFFDVLILDMRSWIGIQCTSFSHASFFIASNSVLPAALLSVLCCFGAIQLVSTNVTAHLKEKTINFLGVILAAGCIALLSAALRPMTCYSHPAGVSSLTTFPAVMCGSDEHIGMLIFGVLQLLLALLYVALVISATLMAPARTYAADDGGRERFLLKVAFLFLRCRSDRWYWTCLMLSRSVLTSLVPVMATNDSSTQVVLCTAWLLLFASLQTYLNPCRVPLFNWIDNSSQWLLALALIAAGVAKDEDSVALSRICMLCLIFPVVMSTLAFGGCALMLFRGDRVKWTSKLLHLRCSTEINDLAQNISVATSSLGEMDIPTILQKLQNLDTYELQAIEAAVSNMVDSMCERDLDLGRAARHRICHDKSWTFALPHTSSEADSERSLTNVIPIESSSDRREKDEKELDKDDIECAKTSTEAWAESPRQRSLPGNLD